MPALKLFWDSVPNAASYTIFWKTTPGVTVNNGAVISGIKNITFEHTNLQSNTIYYYIIVPVDSRGILGPPSAEFSAKTSIPLILSVTPTNANINIGAVQQYTAIVTYSDGITQDVTLQTIWNTSNNAIATIDAGGTATGIVGGVTSILASYLLLNASRPITVM